MVKIGFTGDFCPWLRIEQSYLQGNWQELFESIKPFFDNNDFNVIELECPLTNEGIKLIKTGPHLKSNPLTAEIISFLNCKLVATANNHFLDYGVKGLESSYTALKKYNIDWMGSGFNLESASKTIIKNIGEFTFAFINIAESEWTVTNGNEPGCNPIELTDVFNKITEIKNKVDFILVSVHGGHEHYELPSPRMKKWYRFFVDAGASAVIGHHTHIISGYEVYKETPIFYSLGNFCFDWQGLQNQPWNKGIMVRLRFEKQKPVSFDMEYIAQNNAELGLFLLSEREKETIHKKVLELNTIIQDDVLLEKKFIEYVETWKPVMNTWIQPYRGKYLPSLYKKGLLPSIISSKKKLLYTNLIRCEAHRDILLNSINPNK
jgi:poly-gamma-glutamate synthesis protein (capsule biosynthesis protein)